MSVHNYGIVSPFSRLQFIDLLDDFVVEIQGQTQSINFSPGSFILNQLIKSPTNRKESCNTSTIRRETSI